ncbi:MAG: hypothetical protein RLZZ175_79 [Bacteroidota bacterium]|jgi:DNA primase
MISSYTISQVQQQANVYEVINDFVPLKKFGASYKACCPFHNESTPSFVVSPAKGIYKCFGCSASGDAIKFVMEHEKMSFYETIRYLAIKYNIPIEEDEQSPEQIIHKSEKESLMIVLNFAKNYFNDLLLNNDEGKGIGLSYFKERGFNDKTITSFELGYSLNQWDAFTKHALKNQFSEEILEKAGLLIVKSEDNKKYDRFRGRVMFPIHNAAGRTIAFGARILTNDKSQPKYINSPETEVYIKNQVLYGIFQSKSQIRNLDNCYLVEGYTDVISLHQNGVQNVVASSGTALTEGQIKLISRYTQNVTVLYDGDPAGIKASLRGINLILQQGLNVKVALFPDKEDPDSYVRKVGGEKFEQFIKENAKDFITFKTELFLAEAGNDPVKRSQVIHEIVETISLVPDAIKATIFIQHCSRLLQVEEELLLREYNKLVLGKKKKQQEPSPEVESEFDIMAQIMEAELGLDPSTQQPQKKQANHFTGREAEVLRLLLTYPTAENNGILLYQYILNEIEEIDFRDIVANQILDIFKTELAKNNVLTIDHFMKSSNHEHQKFCIDISIDRLGISENWFTSYQIIVPPKDEDPFSTAFNAINHLKWENIKQLQKETQEALLNAQPEELEELLMLSMHLKTMEREVSKLLGNVVR